MERVQGIGGIFFKAKDKKALAAWYEKHLGVPIEPWGGCNFVWSAQDRPETASTVWSPFEAETTYFEPSTSPFMVNFRVRDLDAMLAQLREGGAEISEKVEASEYGKFGWVMDPEGNKVELWEPPLTPPTG